MEAVLDLIAFLVVAALSLAVPIVAILALVRANQAVLELARRGGVDMPIAEHVAAVVHDGMVPREMVRSLMTRDAKPEWGGE